MRQSTELAWDITDWDKNADVSESNILYNLEQTFLKNGLILPASIVCRIDQEHELLRKCRMLVGDGSGIKSINLQYGEFKLKVLSLRRTELTTAVR